MPDEEPSRADGTVIQSPDQQFHAAAASTAVGVAVPGYVIECELGRGGMGIVYRARQVKPNREVALKMVLGTGTVDSRLLKRFLVEAKVVAAVRHPNVVLVHEYGEADGRPYVAFEYLDGGTLEDFLGAADRDVPHSTASFQEAATLLAQISQGVAAAHELCIIHRDLKPSNILFDKDGTPKVTDFGLAKHGTGSNLTEEHTVMGTPAYMSPEQASGKMKFLRPQADVWALGVIMYELLTGVRPFHAADWRELRTQVLTEDPIPLRKLNRAVPRDLQRICLKCLAKPEIERYPSAAELADDLDCYLEGEPISLRPDSFVKRAWAWMKRN